MDILLIENHVVNFLSNITGQKINQRDVTSSVVFVASLITILLGVMLADGIVTDKEKQKLVEILDRFTIPESDTPRFKYLMIKGVKEYQLYIKFNELVTLTNVLSKSERLLLIGLGYEMSTVENKLGLREQRYLETIAQFLDIKPQHLSVIADVFSPQENFDMAVINEVNNLLTALQPQKLNTEDIQLPSNYKNTITYPRVSIYYEGLKKFQEFSKQLGNYCEHIFQIVQASHELGFLPEDLINEVSGLSRKFQLHKFRLAIIGEFSQGKSTLVNTLLGEEIQPMQEIPCNGTLVILKYGAQKRIICRYQDGSEQEISFDDYRQKLSICENTLTGYLNEEKTEAAIEEIVVEHPNLSLCDSGVEIIDSPGLNENPELTAITQNLLQHIDAAIFVTNASRPLTQSERELLNQLRIELNGGKAEAPANNLFIVCNFIDLISTEKSREHIKNRIYTIVEGHEPIISGKNRVHFISAQAALNAVLNGYEDEYKKSFNDFVKALERFLVMERGKLKLQPLSEQLNNLIKKIIRKMNDFKDDLETKIKVAEQEKITILEQIGGFSGRDVKITLLTIQIIEQALEQARISWNDWNEGLEERMLLRSEQWRSEHKLFWKQDKLIRDYIQCFVRDLSNEIDDWINNELKNVILKQNLMILNRDISYELDSIQAQKNTVYGQELKLSINDITEQLIELDNIDFSAALKGELLVFTGVDFIPLALTNIASVITGSLTSFIHDDNGFHEEIKISVLETGLQKFDESLYKIYQKLQENIEKFFDTKVESVSRVFEGVIYAYEKVLEQQEKSHQEMLEQYYATKSHILNKREELEQINKKISKDITLWYGEDINKITIKTEIK
jgi:replication fork clamp-binding protein CrfC/uncharacterized tellurite resistance protein B-like protein